MRLTNFFLTQNVLTSGIFAEARTRKIVAAHPRKGENPWKTHVLSEGALDLYI